VKSAQIDGPASEDAQLQSAENFKTLRGAEGDLFPDFGLLGVLETVKDPKSFLHVKAA
jgi:hypothetical protein